MMEILGKRSLNKKSVNWTNSWRCFVKEKKKTALGLGIFALGLMFIAIGFFRGEATVIWRKAVNICLECIGLG